MQSVIQSKDEQVKSCSWQSPEKSFCKWMNCSWKIFPEQKICSQHQTTSFLNPFLVLVSKCVLKHNQKRQKNFMLAFVDTLFLEVQVSYEVGAGNFEIE